MTETMRPIAWRISRNVPDACAMLFTMLLAVSASTPLLASDQVPPAQWIWASRPRAANQTAFFRKTFELNHQPRKVELRAVADFNRMTFFVNGRPVADMEDYGPMVKVEVTRSIQQGRNVIAVHSVASDGPAAVAIILDVVFADGSKRSVVTDSTWMSSLAHQANWQKFTFRPDNWQRAVQFGEVDDTFWSDPNRDLAISRFDDYTQWKQALTTDDGGTDPSSFFVKPGFQIELLRSARKAEGSWVSLAFDPRGRLIIARESKGLLRLTLPKNGKDPIRV